MKRIVFMIRRSVMRPQVKWSTRAQLIVVIGVVFVLLTAIVAIGTVIIVDRQIDTVTVGRALHADAGTAEQYRQLDSEHSLSANPDDPYVSVGANGTTRELAISASRGNETARNLLLAATVLPIVVFGMLSAVATWIIATRVQHRINCVARQLRTSDRGLLKHAIHVPQRNDAASIIAQAYNTAVGDLNEAIAREKRFIADASHELKNPLAATSAALEIPLHNGILDDRALPFVEKALASNRGCIILVNRLLELAKIQGLDRAHVDAIDLASIVEESLRQLGDSIPSDLIVNTQTESVIVQADELLMIQLAENLIRNAIEHNCVGGRVWIVTKQDNDAHGTCYATLMVDNTGDDLTDMAMDDLLVPFNRGRASRTSARGSSTGPRVNHGLGLSIVREIVLLHHGTMDLRARAEGGLSVTVRIPLDSHEN